MAPLRVLVVDDYPDAAGIVSTLLEMLGHECRAASRGHDAIEIARAFAPDAAFIDLGLPDVSGFEVARALRLLAPPRALFLAAVTGWGEPHDRARAFAAGFDHHVLKPIDLGIVRRVLHLAETKLVAPTA